MRHNFVVCQLDEKGQERFLESWVQDVWTDDLYRAVSFRRKELAEKIASVISNDSDVPTYARLRVRDA